MELITQIANMITAVVAVVFLALRIIAPYTKTKKDDKILENLK